MEKKFQTCPCCNSAPEYKEILANMLEYIKKDADLIMSEYTLEKVMVDGKIDNIQEVMKNGSLMDIFLNVGKSMEEANKLADRILYIEGRMSAFRDIMDKFPKDK
jgi:hypothetical protein